MYKSCVICPYKHPSVQLVAMATKGRGFMLCSHQQHSDSLLSEQSQQMTANGYEEGLWMPNNFKRKQK